MNNTNQIYRQVLINLQQEKELKMDSDEFKILFNRQDKQKLYINENKYSGAVDTELIGLNNQAKIKGIDREDRDAQVRFIAITDEGSTEMCQSMKDMLFYINKDNEFYRMYGETKNELRNYRIKCHGLVLGINLPPISHHWHWCRSTIVYNTEHRSKEFQTANTVGNEQYKALEQYLKSKSYKINEKLYKNEELNERDKEYIANLDDALKSMPIYKGWVKRSVFVQDNEDIEKVLSIFNNEQRIGNWNSYISSSLDLYDSRFKMYMKIKSKTGRNLSSLNDEGGGEILFMRNTDFQLIDIKNKNGIIYVKLEEV